MKVAIIGNFVVSTCTEQHLTRAFNELGVEVLQWQQDKAQAMGPEAFADQWLGGQSKAYAPKNGRERPALVLYVRTHNDSALGPPWIETWNRLRLGGIVTASFHLDRFWDLEREHLIHEHDPLFATAHVFTADGGNDKRWADAGVNHHWLPPAVDRIEAELPGRPNARLAYDVVFVGSGRQYHGEYPARRTLLDELERVYNRRRFAHVGHGGTHPAVRGQELNDVYASAKVVIGDSCFANEAGSPRCDRYWSDRIPETIGRHGFLLHPYVPGLYDHYMADEVATYNPGDWDDMHAQIGAYLANPGEREGYIERGRARVMRDHTYTNRMRTLLEVCGLEIP